MSTQELLQAALALPATDRMTLAEAIWESIGLHEQSESRDEAQILADVRRRAAELRAGTAKPLSHAEVMERMKSILGDRSAAGRHRQE